MRLSVIPSRVDLINLIYTVKEPEEGRDAPLPHHRISTGTDPNRGITEK